MRCQQMLFPAALLLHHTTPVCASAVPYVMLNADAGAANIGISSSTPAVSRQCSSTVHQLFGAMSAIANAATYDKWFKVADQDMDGRVTGPDAVV